MIVSRDRILTTHVGSLPRNDKLSDLLVRRRPASRIDTAEMAAEMDKAVRHVVDKQVEAGIDIGNDGEQQRVGFQTYVPQRMSGFGGISKRRRGKEFEEFPELVAEPDAALSPCQQAAERAGVPGRAEISRHQAALSRDRALQENSGRKIRRTVYDGAVARHHFEHHARRLLRLAGQISDRDLTRDEERIPGDSQSRPAVADRRAGPRHGPHHDVPRPRRRRLRQDGGAGRGGDQRQASTAFRATACGCTSVTATGKGRTFTISRWKRSCRRSIRRRSARCRSSSPIRATPMNTPRSRSTRCRRTCC